jgi:WD40 repeat protein
VNTVKWLPNVECTDPVLRLTYPEVELASGSSDKNIIIWKMKPDQKWQATAILQGHEDAVTCLARLSLNDGTLLLASCSGDRTVRIWKRLSPREKEGNSKHPTETFKMSHKASNIETNLLFSYKGMKWSVLQVINFPKIMECIAFAFFPQSEIPLLAVGGVDFLIYLFALCEGQVSFFGNTHTHKIILSLLFINIDPIFHHFFVKWKYLHYFLILQCIDVFTFVSDTVQKGDNITRS